MREKYIGKIDFTALLLLGGVKPKTLREWYLDITDDDITKAQRKIEILKSKEVSE